MGKGITDVRGNATIWMMAAMLMVSPAFVGAARAQDKSMEEVIYEADPVAAPMQTTQVAAAAVGRSSIELPAGMSAEQREALMSRMRDRVTSTTASRVRGRQAEATPAAGAAKADDNSTTMMLNLNNMQLDQLMKWLGDTTGRPIVKQNNIQGQVTVMSPKPVTKERALQLISRALQMQNPPVFIIDDGESLQIITAEQIKVLPRRSIGPDEDIQTLPDSPQLGQKVYKPKLITADNLAKHLQNILPKDSVSVDPASNTIMLVDQISRLKQYDLLVKALDQPLKEDRVTEVYPLENADVSDIAPLVLNVLSQTSSTGSTPSRGGSDMSGGGGMSPDMMMMMGGGRSRGGSSSSSSAPKSSASSAGEVTIVSDPRMNWLIIVAPQRRIAEVRELIKKFDVAKDQDVQTRLIPVKYIEVSSLQSAAQDLIANASRNKSERDQVSVIASDDGNNLVVKSSLANFKLVQDLATKLDTETAGKRETKTYQIKHLEAAGLAEQLQQLYEDQSNRRSSWYDYYYGGSNRQDSTKPTFTPMPRNNTLMVRARPRDFEFISKMITELDVPADETQYRPRVFQIRNTDANEVLKVLTQIFEGKQQKRGVWDDYYESWYGSRQKTPDSIDAQFGKIRFVVDNVTNRIVALSSNPANYTILEGIINQLDTFDSDSAQLMIYELHYADALDVANHINNLLSDGPVSRGTTTGGGNSGSGSNSNSNPWNSSSNDNTSNNDSDAQLASYFYDGQREVIFPWQSPGRQQQNQDEKERPVSTMIGHVRIVPDLASNRVIVAAPTIYYNSLKKILSELDQPQPQVHIQVRIVEISRNGEERIGIRWTPDMSTISKDELDGAMLGLSQLNFADAFGPHGSSYTGSASTVLSDNSLVKSNWATETRRGNTLLTAGINLNLLVQLLIKNSNGRVVSSPELTVNNNQLGHFKVTSSYPFLKNSQATEAGSLTQGYDYNEYGIFLLVRPHINPKGEIVLKAAVENSKVRSGETFNGQLIADLQRLESEMKINSGETMVIGGIKQDDRQKIEHGVPILSRIPVVKWLFSKKDDVVRQKELVLFLTPEVLKTDQDKAGILERQNKQVDQMDPFPEHKWRDMQPAPKK